MEIQDAGTREKVREITLELIGAGADSSQSPTLTRGTAMGAIMGTAAYMSPEQARGKPLDKRTDLWAFGVVVYETLTGQRAFKGEDVSETLAFVLTKAVDWDALPEDTPSSLRRLLRRALERDRRERLADAADARLELRDAVGFEGASGGKAATTAATGWRGGDVRNWKIAVLSLDTEREEVRVVIHGGTSPRYSPTGHIVYSLSGQLLAVPFDAHRLEVTGDPVTLPQSVFETGSGAANFALSSNGVLASISETPNETSQSRLVWVDRQGEATPVPYRSEGYIDVALSPDGEQMAVDSRSTGDAARDIWIYDVERGARTRLTLEGGAHPVWTPDGTRVAFAIPGVGLFWRPVDGSREAESLLIDEHVWMANSFSPDGKLLAFTSGAGETLSDIWLLSLEEGPSPFLSSPALEEGPMFSPDGRFLAYVSAESGTPEVYVRPYPGPSGRVAISIGGGRAPVWSPDGTEIFYRGLEQGQMMAVAVVSEPTFEAGRARALFDELYFAAGPGDPHYDVSRDGKRFLMIDQEDVVEGGASTQIVVTLNWFQELERLVPTR